MTFNYFPKPEAFAYMADKGQLCHFCSTSVDCLAGANLFGQRKIEAVCFTCMKAGRLIELDISTNEIRKSALHPSSNFLEISNEITYCTPSLPTWQDCLWPVKNGKPYRFIKIASKIDYKSKEQFVNSLFDCETDSELWDMLPEDKVENMKDGQYDISFYLFENSGDTLTIWDAN